MFSDLAQSLLAPLLKKNGHRNNVISDSCLLGDDLAAFSFFGGNPVVDVLLQLLGAVQSRPENFYLHLYLLVRNDLFHFSPPNMLPTSRKSESFLPW